MHERALYLALRHHRRDGAVGRGRQFPQCLAAAAKVYAAADDAAERWGRLRRIPQELIQLHVLGSHVEFSARYRGYRVKSCAAGDSPLGQRGADSVEVENPLLFTEGYGQRMQRSRAELQLIDPQRDIPVSAQQSGRPQLRVGKARLDGGFRAELGGVCPRPQVRQTQPLSAQCTLNGGPVECAIDQQVGAARCRRS